MNQYVPENDKVTVEVNIISDVVCPWCIVGFKQLERALQSAPDLDVNLRWQPFELNPHMPEKGQNLREHLIEKAGITPAQSQAARAKLTALGGELGFAFNFRDDMRIANTFRAHQLLHWAEANGRQTQLKLELFEAYFGRGEDINNVEVLASVAHAVGLDEEEARATLADERFATPVRLAEKRWLDRDIHGVPAFLFNERYAVLGAQSEDAFQRIFDKLRQS